MKNLISQKCRFLRRDSLIVPLVAALVLAVLFSPADRALAATTGVVAADDASNYSGWGGSNTSGGYGFGNWTFDNAGSGTYGDFLGSSTQNAGGSSGGNINSSNGTGNSWAMYNYNGTGTEDAYRTINSVTSADASTADLEIGEILRADIDNGYLNNGASQGFSIRNSAGQNLFEFYFTAGSSDYTYTNGGTATATTVGFTGNGLRTEFMLTDATHYTFSIYSTNATGGQGGLLQTVTGTLTTESSGETVSIIRPFDYDPNSSNTGDYNYFFNNLKVKLASWVGGSSGNFSTGGNWVGLNLGGTLTNSSDIAFDGGSGVITATNDAMTTVNNISFNQSGTAIANGPTTVNATTYTIAGSATDPSLTVNNGINNNSTNTQTFTTGLALGASQTFAATNGSLIFSGTVATGGNTLTTSGTGNQTFNGVINGTGGLTASGSGTVTISSLSSYSGATAVNAGTLIVSGSLSGTISATVASGATLELDGSMNNSATTTVNGGTLKGIGSVGPVTENGGALDPGLTAADSLTATGTLTASGAVSLSSTTNFNIRLGMMTGANDNDQLAGSSAVTLHNTPLKLTMGSFMNNPANLNKLYVIVAGGAGSTGSGTDEFDNGVTALANNATFTTSGYTFEILYHVLANGTGSGNDVVLEMTAVPEPGTWAMFLAGAGTLLAFQRARRRSNL